MKKYVILIAGVLLNTHLYADSYVFGGRAHFYGALVNQSCSISFEQTVQDVIEAPQSLFNFIFRYAPTVSTIILQLVYLSKINKFQRFFKSPQAKNDLDKEINIQNFESMSRGQSFISQFDHKTHYGAISTKSVNIFLQPTLKSSLNQSPNILISIFYP